jgi:hypothetical protein
MSKLIFHHPLPLDASEPSGSRVRPRRMLDAFEAMGCEVVPVIGHASERKAAMREIKQRINAGEQFDCCYAESATAPTMLTEPHHLPLHPLLDTGFFAWLRRRGIPVGLFMRDMHWAYDLFPPHLAGWKRWLIKMCFRWEFHRYQHAIDLMFLPDLAMAESIPGRWLPERLSALPPGCELRQPRYPEPSAGTLRLFYVGGVLPPLYDLTLMLMAANQIPGMELTICCRKAEWSHAAHYYGQNLPANVRVVHASGEELAAYYAEADAFILAIGSHHYLQLTIPVKITETIGYGTPIIAVGDTAGSRFVRDNGFGWLVADDRGLLALLVHLRDNPEELSRKRELLLEKRQLHSWVRRANDAALQLRHLAGDP